MKNWVKIYFEMAVPQLIQVSNSDNFCAYFNLRGQKVVHTFRDCRYSPWKIEIKKIQRPCNLRDHQLRRRIAQWTSNFSERHLNKIRKLLGTFQRDAKFLELDYYQGTKSNQVYLRKMCHELTRNVQSNTRRQGKESRISFFALNGWSLLQLCYSTSLLRCSALVLYFFKNLFHFWTKLR